MGGFTAGGQLLRRGTGNQNLWRNGSRGPYHNGRKSCTPRIRSRASAARHRTHAATVNGVSTVNLLQIDGAERERRLSAWSALPSLSHPHLIRVFEQAAAAGALLRPGLAVERMTGYLAAGAAR